jgi:hypothetical protein
MVEPIAVSIITEESPKDKCSLSPVTGKCDAIIQRFYFNAGTCKKFIWGGCGGNANNFETKEECLAACRTEGRICKVFVS